MHAKKTSEVILLSSYAGVRKSCSEQPVRQNSDVVKSMQSVVCGKSLLQTSTKGFYHACRNDLNILTSYHHPMPKPPLLMCKYKAQETKLTYLIFHVRCRSLFALGHSLIATLLPMMTIIHKRQTKNSTCI
jgi:hypothetical protein